MLLLALRSLTFTVFDFSPALPGLVFLVRPFSLPSGVLSVFEKIQFSWKFVGMMAFRGIGLLSLEVDKMSWPTNETKNSRWI
jgi:hypothetical protein